MDSDEAKHSKAFRREHKVEMKPIRLPQRLDQLEWVARHVFVPRLEAIFKAMSDEQGTLTIRPGSSEGCPGSVLIDLIFGREETAHGHWTVFLVRVELEPRSNMVCIQAGQHLHMNRQFAFGEAGWESKLIDGFDWVLSDSMRPNLRIRDWPVPP